MVSNPPYLLLHHEEVDRWIVVPAVAYDRVARVAATFRISDFYAFTVSGGCAEEVLCLASPVITTYTLLFSLSVSTIWMRPLFGG